VKWKAHSGWNLFSQKTWRGLATEHGLKYFFEAERSTLQTKKMFCHPEVSGAQRHSFISVDHDFSVANKKCFATKSRRHQVSLNKKKGQPKWSTFY